MGERRRRNRIDCREEGRGRGEAPRQLEGKGGGEEEEEETAWEGSTNQGGHPSTTVWVLGFRVKTPNHPHCLTHLMEIWKTLRVPRERSALGEVHLWCLKGRLREVGVLARDHRGVPHHELPGRSDARAGDAVVPADGAERHLSEAIQVAAWLRRLRVRAR